jgi:hypothetical protein
MESIGGKDSSFGKTRIKRIKEEGNNNKLECGINSCSVKGKLRNL